MNKTPIEWVKNPDGTQGYTWNPITGCLNGCEYCYARKLANGRLRDRYLANTNYIGQDTRLSLDDVNNLASIVDPCADPFYPRFWEDRLYHAWGGEPKGIFVCDMSDLFGIGIPDEWTYKVMNLIKLHSENRYYLLTKQPQNLPQWSPFPDNCWVGVTATNAEMTYQAYWHLGIKVEAKVKFLSFEPLLNSVSISSGKNKPRWLNLNSINWVIIGALTGTKQELLSLKTSAPLQLMPYGKKWTLQPKISWVEEIVRAADKAGIPVFLKDNLRPIIPERQRPFWYVDHFESHLRQEMPDA